MKKILLLDIENLHKSEQDLVKYLKQYLNVYLIYAKSPVSFSLDGLVALSQYLATGKLKVIKMPKIGKDAADFGLAFIAGQLSVQVKKDVAFDVMSNDHSMHYIVDLLSISGFEAKVIDEKPLVTAHISQEIKASNDISKYIYQYCQNLAKSTFSRPAKTETLINSIKANLRCDEAIARVIVEDLKKLKIIKISDNKVQYNQAAIARCLINLEHLAETAETAETAEVKLNSIQRELLSYFTQHKHMYPRSLTGLLTLVKKCMPEENSEEIIDLLRKTGLITVNNKRQIGYSTLLLPN